MEKVGGTDASPHKCCLRANDLDSAAKPPRGAIQEPRFDPTVGRWKRFVTWACVIALGVAAYYVRVWCNRPDAVTVFTGDLLSSYLPNVQFSMDMLRAGRLPLWNPYEFAGMPMFATLEYAPLYPTTWLAMFMPPDTAHLLTALLHQVLLGTGVYLYARHSLKLRRDASLLGAFALCLAGSTLRLMGSTADEFRSFSWLPLILMLTDRVFAKPCPTRAAALAAAVAMQFLGGEAEIAVRTFFLLAPYAALRLGQTYRRGGLQHSTRAAAALAFAGAAALGLVAVQLLPTAELARQGARNIEGLSFRQAFQGGLGDAATLLRYMTCDTTQPTAKVYIGALTLFLALYAWRRPKMETAYFTLLALCAFDLMRDEPSFVARVYYHLPTGAWFRAPARFAPYLATAVAVLAAYGFHHLRTDLASARTRDYWGGVAFLAAGAFVALWWDIQASSIESSALLVTLLAVAAAAVLHQVRAMGNIAPWLLTGAGLAGIAFIPCAVMDLQQFIIPRNPDYICLPKTVRAFLAERLQPGERIYADFATLDSQRVPKLGLLLRQPCINGFSPFMPRAYWEFLRPYRSERIEAKGLAAADTGHAPIGIWGGLALASGAQEAFNLLGVRYLLVGLGTELFYPHMDTRQIPALPEGLRTVYHEGPFAIIENTGAFPRAFVIPDAEQQPAPHSPRDLLWLGSERRVAARLLADEPGYTAIETPPGQAGWLVLTDQSFPGWRATVDGRRQPIESVAGLFRGVRVGIEDHVVEFRYVPRTVLLGAGVTALTVLLLTGLSVIPLYKTHPLEP